MLHNLFQRRVHQIWGILRPMIEHVSTKTETKVCLRRLGGANVVLDSTTATAPVASTATVASFSSSTHLEKYTFEFVAMQVSGTLYSEFLPM
jgi:hypothetical protein